MNWRSTVALLAAILVSMVGITSAAFAQRSDGWELLGATRIGGYGFDLDEINVGKRRGYFEKIRVRARSNGVYVRSLRVVYGNDETQDIRMGRRLREGQQTAPIELEGTERFIKRIEIVARTRGRRATVYMQDLKVVYDRGLPDSIPVRAQIRAGGETKPLDLRGARRHIKLIELSYGSKPSVRGQPVVCVFGRP